MAQITFSCPSCHRSIECDDAWIGQQIACPLCNAQFTVPKAAAQPASPLVPKPTEAGGKAKLSAGATSVARSSFGGAAQTRTLVEKKKKSNSALKTVATVVILVAVGAAGYLYGWPAFQKWRTDKAAAKEAAEAEAARAANEAAQQEQPQAPPPPSSLPVIPPVYTLDVAKAQIPEAKLNGQISGTNFVMESAKFDRTAASCILNLRQGTGATPDRGIMVYMRLAPTEIPTNRTFTVSSTEKSTAVTQITKLWKTNPRYAASTKPYFTGYALKMEFGGQAEDGSIPGKMYLALPDTERSVVAGMFVISNAPAGTMGDIQTAQPMSQGDSEAQRRFQERYGPRR